MVMKERKVDVSGKPKHSLDVYRIDGKSGTRTAGKILKHEYQEKDLPNTRMQPDRRWFDNTRVIDPKKLEEFRDELGNKLSSNYNVILQQRLLPMSLLQDHQKKALSVEGSQADGLRDLVRHGMFENGESKRIGDDLYKVIDSLDVIVQVLDARDPQGTRCYLLERHLNEHCKHKHMVFLLNKCDLVPEWATKGWIRVLSKDYPTLAFQASINKSFGKELLLSVLGQLASLKCGKQAISVGFVGYPNVGKSSVMNTLRAKSVCEVAPTAGETKVLQYIKLTEQIFLIDCPGVVYQNRDTETAIIFKGAVRVTNLEDAAKHIREVLRRVKKKHLQRAYKIKDWVDQEDFLIQLCKMSGLLLKGTEPDMTSAAEMVLHDWQRGRVPYFVTPPKQENANEQPSTASANEETVVGN
ncbi:hypothetical protein C5167_019357 [Papaver somniferum]|uniref:Nuclear/nucleolar GTPase 2 n=1 Tax=Papaver somniferum TaxID=3469 RepID=A0A4Y7IS12_PAPSO|nr:hypothetical protein C5167_019357 [Papaver somniferum]